MSLDDTDTIYPGLPLKLEDDFRLVEIQPGRLTDVICCNIFSTAVRDAPKYEALSYTWGDPADKQSIVCKDAAGNGAGRLLVTQNCAAALRRLRLKDSVRTVWIDSICIDQNEVTERNHQLRLMAQIYTQAEQVVIYLGESSDDSDSAMDWIHQIYDPDFSYESPYANSRSSVIRPETQMIKSLMSRPWFNRIWVLQEVVLSKSAIVYCGRKTISWDAFKHFKEFNTSVKWVERLPYVIERRQNTVNDTVAIEFQVLRELLQARHCESTDPRDKVYALLPLLSYSGINVNIIPNYSHLATRVFTDVATYLMSCIGLELLCTVCGRSQLPDLPSWVPDWGIRTQRLILGLNQCMRRWSNFSHFRAGGEFVIPSQSNSQGVSSFIIDRVDENNMFSVRLKTQGLRLGKITGIGDPCVDNSDIPPFRQWKEVASKTVPVADIIQAIQDQEDEASEEANGRLSDFGNKIQGILAPPTQCFSKPIISASSVSTLSRNDSFKDRPGDLFEYTIIIGNFCYPRPIRRAVQQFITDDGSESSKMPIREWMKGLPPSDRREVEKILESCRGRRFLVTDTNYMGLAPVEAQSGDFVFIVPGVSVPFVFREENDGLRLIGECYVQNVMDGEVIPELDASRFEDIVII